VRFQFTATEPSAGMRFALDQLTRLLTFPPYCSPPPLWRGGRAGTIGYNWLWWHGCRLS
jgi:hypothetical protein